MKQRVGFICLGSGILLLMNPSLDMNEVTILLNYIVVHYWPIALIFLGASLMSQKRKPRRNKN